MRQAYAIVFLISCIHALRLLPINDNSNAMSFEEEEAECRAKFEHHSEEMLRLLDYPQLMCSPPFPEHHNYSFTKISEFPDTHLKIRKDPKHEHIIVEGSESSGSHFMIRLVAESLGILDLVTSDTTITDNVVLYHVSQPEGSACQFTKRVPLLDDYGCVETQTSECEMPLKTVGRLVIKVKDVVMNYRERGESIKVIQTVRDPEISMLANHKGHCTNGQLEIEDNEIAFKLMLEAQQLDEVTTVCYEQMLDEGEAYVARLFQKAGLNPHLQNFPKIQNGNAKYSVRERKCGFSSSAYMTLCPESPHTKELRRMGCKELK